DSCVIRGRIAAFHRRNNLGSKQVELSAKFLCKSPAKFPAQCARSFAFERAFIRLGLGRREGVLTGLEFCAALIKQVFRFFAFYSETGEFIFDFGLAGASRDFLLR